MYHTSFKNEETGTVIVVHPSFDRTVWLAKVLGDEDSLQEFLSYEDACKWAEANL
jgi:hypothetical protein